MNKKLEQFAAKYNFALEKNRMHGTFNGYAVSAYGWSGMSTICLVGIHVFLGTKAGEVMNQFTLRLKKQLRLQQIGLDSSGVYFAFVPMTMGSMLKRLDEIFSAVTECLRSLEIDGSVCPYCGQPMEESIEVEDMHCRFRAHEQCFEGKRSQVQEAEKAEEELPNNYGRGILGALVGGLLGCVIFVILYMLGFVASISSFVGMVLGAVLYSKFGGKNNKVKILFVCIVPFIMILLTFYFCNVYTVAQAMAEEGIMGSASSMFWLLVQENEEVRSAVMSDFAVTLLFTIIGIVVNIGWMIGQQKKISSGMKKV